MYRVGRTDETSKATESARCAVHLKAAKRYLVATIGCVAFALIYAQFSHGVYSPFMTFMFAIPLVGGALVSVALYLARAQELSRASRHAWALAIASLTVASCLRGVFDIAGTASPYLPIYLGAAAVFALVAAVRLRR